MKRLSRILCYFGIHKPSVTEDDFGRKQKVCVRCDHENIEFYLSVN